MTKVREKQLCPRCKKSYTEYPATSRKDNRTAICPTCGMAEAFEDYLGTPYEGERYWLGDLVHDAQN